MLKASYWMRGESILRLKRLKNLLKKKVNRPWRPIGLRDLEDPTFSRQSAHRLLNNQINLSVFNVIWTDVHWHDQYYAYFQAYVFIWILFYKNILKVFPRIHIKLYISLQSLSLHMVLLHFVNV
jgi:hypothetical protein